MADQSYFFRPTTYASGTGAFAAYTDPYFVNVVSALVGYY
jgi:hypothetical protein